MSEPPTCVPKGFTNLSLESESKPEINGFCCNFSYFEVRRGAEFMTRYPGATEPGTIPTDPRVFNMRDLHENGLMDFIEAVTANKFCVSDFLWFLPLNFLKPGATYSASDVIAWMESLRFDMLSFKDNMSPSKDKVISIERKIMSTLDPEFSCPAYLASTSLPQEAIDSIPMTIRNGKLYVALGRRAKCIPIVITDSHGNTIICHGNPNYILYGEHLEPKEKDALVALYAAFLATGLDYMAMPSRKASAALRALAEEGGFVVEADDVLVYILKKSEEPGRDLRYWIFSAGEGKPMFGYKRNSFSYNILFVLPTLDIEEPLDTFECQKGAILSAEVALHTFCRGGSIARVGEEDLRFEPVFPAHAGQMEMAIAVAQTILDSRVSSLTSECKS